MTTNWVPVPEDSLFPLENLPYGIFSVDAHDRRVGVAIGEHVLDLTGLEADRVLDDTDRWFADGSLNRFLAAGRGPWSSVRTLVTDLLSDPSSRARVEPMLHPLSKVKLHLPFEVADYVDFYSSIHHAQNLGRLFRPDAEPLTPNWRHLPIGYHGRSGTIVASGTKIVRPSGQRKGPTDDGPTFGPSERLDIEAEVGFVVGVGSELGQRVSAAELPDHVFGVVLVNDWSARDIQAWEYVPLGPFLGKSFATSISPWIVTLDALVAARVQPPDQKPPPLAYLHDHDPWSLDLSLEVAINRHVVSKPPFADMYWTPGQQLAHMTANGASLRTGDLFASGTVSGPHDGQQGSLIELTRNGARPLRLPDGSTRRFLEDNDTVTITACAQGTNGRRIGFGSVTGTIVPGPVP